MERLIKLAASKANEIRKKVPASVITGICRVATLLPIVCLGVAIVALPFVTTAWEWLPRAGDVRTLLATLLTAQAAIAALTLAVTLFVMQGVSNRRDADDRMYREYVRQSWVQPIFWGSIAAVSITGSVFLAQEFVSGVDRAADIVPGLRNLSLVAAFSFLANLGLSCVLFQRALRLAHPQRWSILRRSVNERDVRESVQAFLDRSRRAALSLETNKADLSVLLPDPGEGSADEAIRALLDDARRAMAESRLRELRQSIESITGLIEDAMNEIEREGVAWALPGSQPGWPPLRELGRNLYSFREEIIREGHREYVFRLLELDYWLTITGMRRRSGDLFTAGLDGYRRNYQIASRIGDAEFRELFRDRVWQNAHHMITGQESEEVFPYALELVQHQERVLSDAMQIDQPADFESLHKGFEASLQFIRWDWERDSRSPTKASNLYWTLEQNYRIVLMGLAGRAIILAEEGRQADPARYLEVARRAISRSDRLADDTAQALLRHDRVENTQWSAWEWERAEPGKVQTLDRERYPLTFFAVRLVELSSKNMPALNLRGSAKMVLEWFVANSDHLQAYASVEPTSIKERIALVTRALQDAVKLDEVTEDYRVIDSEISAERISDFKSSVYASAFASDPVERLFDQAGAFVYLPCDTDSGPEERDYRTLEPKAFLAVLPADSSQYYAPLEGDQWGQDLAADILLRLCEALDEANEILVPLNTFEVTSRQVV